MRNQFLVSYDICHPKRLRNVHKKMKGFGKPMQYSVFLCPLSPTERIRLLDELGSLIHHGEDRVMIIDLGPVDGRAIDVVEFLGKRDVLPGSDPHVV